LTAGALGGVLPGGALAAGVPAGSPTSTDGSAAPLPASGGEAQAQQTGAGGVSTSTSTTPSSSSTSTTSAPSSVSAGPASSVPRAGAPDVPVVRLQRRQRITAAPKRGRKPAHAGPKGARRRTRRTHSSRHATATRHKLAPPPQLAGDRLRALMAELAFSGASARSLAFYRIPLFLLPIYRAASARYAVPWRILAAINEVETDYGNEESVSTAGAVGWMQFMPETWMRYGVDASGAGDADPYNPVDAIFAAARYLRDMGAAKDLRAAILAYNHSAAYVESVMLRAELISTYPKPVIATLTSLADGRPPLTGGHVAWGVLHPRTSSSPSTATANAKAVAPATAAAAATGPHAGQLADVRGAPNAAVVAVRDGRIVGLGSSRKLGKYVILRDLHGDVFTYSGLGGIAASYIVAKTSHRSIGARDVRLPLRRGSLVKQGAVLGRVRVPVGARDGHLRFAIRPARDRREIDPRPILANWALLAVALHPPGASGRVDPLDAAAAASRGGSTPAAGAARSTRSGRGMPSPIVVRGELSAVRWDRLIAHIGALSAPTVAVNRSYWAIGDRWDAASGRGVLEGGPLSSGGLGR
jgi:soluble lytic murein transglycosylase-like protein